MTDRYGVTWDLPASELCSECGQPDNCGDCNHEPLSKDDVYQLKGGDWPLVDLPGIPALSRKMEEDR